MNSSSSENANVSASNNYNSKNKTKNIKPNTKNKTRRTVNFKNEANILEINRSGRSLPVGNKARTRTRRLLGNAPPKIPKIPSNVLVPYLSAVAASKKNTYDEMVKYVLQSKLTDKLKRNTIKKLHRHYFNIINNED